MKTRYQVCLFLLAAVLVTGSVIAIASPDPPAAVLLGCRGSVTIVKSGGQTVTGTFGTALEPGDEVRTGKDSQAEVHFDNGQWVQIGANSRTQVHGQKANASAGTSLGEKSFEVVQNFLKLKNAEGTSSLARLRSGEQHASLRALSPLQTKVRDALPTFRWSVSDPSTELRLVLYNDRGVHWKQDAPKGTSELVYPSDAPVLESGVTYSWVLESTDPLVFPALRSEAGFFEILRPEDTRTLDASLAEIEKGTKTSESTYHVFRASLFFDHGLMEDAIAETVTALEVDPENSGLHAILARLYAETGRTQDAIREYDRLLEKR